MTRTSSSFVVGDLEFETVERTAVRVEPAWGGVAGGALKEPVALVIRSPGGEWQVDLEQLDRPFVRRRRDLDGSRS